MSYEIEQRTAPGKPGLLPLDGGGGKVILHTTEVGYETNPNGTEGLISRCRRRDLTAFAEIYRGVAATWERGSGFPTQYLIDVPNRRIARFIPDRSGGYALEDTPGGIRPNRAGLPPIQIELVAHTHQIREEFSDADWRWLGGFLSWLCQTNGIPYTFPVEFIDNAYGPNRVRLTGPEFLAARGIVGHQHTPENAHSDPGAIRVDLMLDTGQPGGELPPPDPTPAYPDTLTTGDDDVTTLYVTNAEQRTEPPRPGGAVWGPGELVYAIERGLIRNVRPAENFVRKAQLATAENAGDKVAAAAWTAVAVSSEFLNDQLAWTAQQQPR